MKLVPPNFSGIAAAIRERFSLDPNSPSDKIFLDHMLQAITHSELYKIKDGDDRKFTDIPRESRFGTKEIER